MNMSKVYTSTSTGKEVGASGKRATSVLNIVIYQRIEVTIGNKIAGCFMTVILCSSLIFVPKSSFQISLRQILLVSSIIHDLYIKF